MPDQRAPDHAPDAAGIRRAKRLLRYMPRRAALHRYPLIGRFAHRLRTKSYLWSFRRKDTWRAYYVGSILSFLPLMGIQLPLGLVGSLIFRTNFMIVGGLQFLTNPLTAAPVYYGTYRVGDAVLSQFRGARPPGQPEPTEAELAQAGSIGTDEILEPLGATAPQPQRWTKRAAGMVDALLVGGLIVGVAFGLLLDVLDMLLRRRASLAKSQRQRAS
jgi:uncharacterized protein (DUF2062 family)